MATFTITDANFYPEDLLNDNPKGNGIWVENVDTAQKVQVDVMDWTRGESGTAAFDVWTGTITITGDGDYRITMEYTDRSDNKMPSYKSDVLTIDTVKPVISLEYDNNDVANEKYFRATSEQRLSQSKNTTSARTM